MDKNSGDDMNKHDAHYKMAIEPWDAMKVWLTAPEFRGFLKGNVVKYVARAGKKEGSKELTDLEKAHSYLTKLIDFIKLGNNL
jgi:hypothetical protein